MKTIKKMQKTIIASAIMAVLATTASIAESADVDTSYRIEEIIVTAQKREESLQETPISMAAFGADALKMKRIENLEDLYTQVPNMNFTPHPNSASTAQIYIRGIGIIDDQMTQDPSVGVYMDGVYLARSQGLMLDIADIERIEVLRGPQGTLYGRNTTGGAVNFITKRPSYEELNFSQSFSLGNRDLWESKTSLNAPIGNKAAIKVSFFRSMQDGFVSNEGTGVSDFGSKDRSAQMVDFLWQMFDSVDVRYVYDQSSIKDSPAYLSVIPGSYHKGHRPSKGSPFVKGLRNNDNESKGHALTLTWSVNDNIDLKSISSYRKLNSVNYQDYLTGAVAPLPVFITDYSLDQKQYSQEIQIIGSNQTKDLKYIFGLYYFKEDANGFDLITIPLQNQVVNRKVDIENTAKAIYGQVSYLPSYFDSALEITIGGRWSRDERAAKMSQAYGAVGGVLFPSPAIGNGDKNFTDFSPSLIISYKLAEEINFYFKYAQGYKTGGFNIRASTIEKFNEGYGNEDLDSYEIGLKSTWLDGRLRVNAAGFISKYDSMQVNTLVDPNNTSVSDILNAGKASISGFEFDILSMLTKNISVGLNYGYVDADYDEIKTATGVNIASRFRFIHVPRNSYSFDINYDAPGLGVGDLRANLNYTWQDKQLSNTTINLGGRFGISSYGLINARVAYGGIKALSGEFEAAIWGKNLADKDYMLVLINTGFPSGFHAEPRTVGVDLSYKY